MAGKSEVFVSYRRADSAGWTGRLVADLREHFEGLRIFMDLQAIGGGDDFRVSIDRALASAGVVLIVIGPQWLTLLAADGSPRLFAADDLVHIEVARALTLRDARVIPVLVGDARMPGAEQLPRALAPLARLHAVQLSDARWEYDLNRLIQALNAASGVRHANSRLRHYLIASALAVPLLAGIAWYLQHERDRDPPAERATTAASATPVPVSPAPNAMPGPLATPGNVGSPANRAPDLAAKLDGLWAGEFVSRAEQRRSREMLSLEVEGSFVYGQNWVETWEQGSSKPHVFRKFSLVDGKIEGDIVSFCIHLTEYFVRDPVKFRQCFRGTVHPDHIAFRATNYLDHPRESPVEEKFIAHRIGDRQDAVGSARSDSDAPPR